MSTTAPSTPPALLDHEQAASLLGISPSTLKRMARAGKIGPAPIKFSSRLVRWPEAELRAWAAAGCPSRKKWAERRGGGAA